MAAQSQGEYNHATYLTRQQLVLPNTTASANATNTEAVFPVSAMRIRAVALRALTTASLSSTYLFQAGTASVGQIIITTATVGQVLVSTDLNATLAQGTAFCIKNSADTASSFAVVAEAHIDPASVFTGS